MAIPIKFYSAVPKKSTIRTRAETKSETLRETTIDYRDDFEALTIVEDQTPARSETEYGTDWSTWCRGCTHENRPRVMDCDPEPRCMDEASRVGEARRKADAKSAALAPSAALPDDASDLI